MQAICHQGLRTPEIPDHDLQHREEEVDPDTDPGGLLRFVVTVAVAMRVGRVGVQDRLDRKKMAILDCSSRKSRERTMQSISEILTQAQDRAQQAHLPYVGALTPLEAHAILSKAPQAKLVDVRARAEWDLAGIIPGAVQIEWQTYPGWHANPYFLQQFKQMVDPEALVMFICS